MSGLLNWNRNAQGMPSSEGDIEIVFSSDEANNLPESRRPNQYTQDIVPDSLPYVLSGLKFSFPYTSSARLKSPTGALESLQHYSDRGMEASLSLHSMSAGGSLPYGRRKGSFSPKKPPQKRRRLDCSPCQAQHQQCSSSILPSAELIDRAVRSCSPIKAEKGIAAALHGGSEPDRVSSGLPKNSRRLVASEVSSGLPKNSRRLMVSEVIALDTSDSESEVEDAADAGAPQPSQSQPLSNVSRLKEGVSLENEAEWSQLISSQIQGTESQNASEATSPVNPGTKLNKAAQLSPRDDHEGLKNLITATQSTATKPRRSGMSSQKSENGRPELRPSFLMTRALPAALQPQGQACTPPDADPSEPIAATQNRTTASKPGRVVGRGDQDCCETSGTRQFGSKTDLEEASPFKPQLLRAPFPDERYLTQLSPRKAGHVPRMDSDEKTAEDRLMPLPAGVGSPQPRESLSGSRKALSGAAIRKPKVMMKGTEDQEAMLAQLAANRSHPSVKTSEGPDAFKSVRTAEERLTVEERAQAGPSDGSLQCEMLPQPNLLSANALHMGDLPLNALLKEPQVVEENPEQPGKQGKKQAPSLKLPPLRPKNGRKGRAVERKLESSHLSDAPDLSKPKDLEADWQMAMQLQAGRQRRARQKPATFHCGPCVKCGTKNSTKWHDGKKANTCVCDRCHGKPPECPPGTSYHISTADSWDPGTAVDCTAAVKEYCAEFAHPLNGQSIMDVCAILAAEPIDLHGFKGGYRERLQKSRLPAAKRLAHSISPESLENARLEAAQKIDQDKRALQTNAIDQSDLSEPNAQRTYQVPLEQPGLAPSRNRQPPGGVTRSKGSLNSSRLPMRLSKQAQETDLASDRRSSGSMSWHFQALRQREDLGDAISGSGMQTAGLGPMYGGAQEAINLGPFSGPRISPQGLWPASAQAPGSNLSRGSDSAGPQGILRVNAVPWPASMQPQSAGFKPALATTDVRGRILSKQNALASKMKLLKSSGHCDLSSGPNAKPGREVHAAFPLQQLRGETGSGSRHVAMTQNGSLAARDGASDGCQEFLEGPLAPLRERRDPRKPNKTATSRSQSRCTLKDSKNGDATAADSDMTAKRGRTYSTLSDDSTAVPRSQKSRSMKDIMRRAPRGFHPDMNLSMEDYIKRGRATQLNERIRNYSSTVRERGQKSSGTFESP